MSSYLTEKQKNEMHKAIFTYLAAKCPDIEETLATALALDDSFDDAKRKSYEGLLEKKWSSNLRLQKKVMTLETRIDSLQSELNNATPTSLTRKNTDAAGWLPQAPALYTLESHQKPITCVAFHPVYELLASGSEDMTIKIWSYEHGELLRTIKGHTQRVLDVDFGGPRKTTLLASCSTDSTIKLWDPNDDYNNIRTLAGHDHSVSCVRFVPSGAADSPSSGNLLVSASRDMTLRIWDVTTGFCVKTISGHGDWVRAVAPSFDGRWFLSANNNSTAQLWDANNGELKLTLDHEHAVECVAFAPPACYAHLALLAGRKEPAATASAEFLATGSRDKFIKLWDGRGSLIKKLSGHDNWVRALVFHPGGRYLLSCSDDKSIRCWDLAQGAKCVKVLSDAHGHFVNCMRWAPPRMKHQPPSDGDANGAPALLNGARKEVPRAMDIRCVIATGSVDQKLRVFAS